MQFPAGPRYHEISWSIHCTSGAGTVVVARGRKPCADCASASCTEPQAAPCVDCASHCPSCSDASSCAASSLYDSSGQLTCSSPNVLNDCFSCATYDSSCYSAPHAAAAGAVCTVQMFDAYGDGWSGASMSAPGWTNETFSLTDGFVGNASFTVPLADSQHVTSSIEVTLGNAPATVFWRLYCYFEPFHTGRSFYSTFHGNAFYNNVGGQSFFLDPALPPSHPPSSSSSPPATLHTLLAPPPPSPPPHNHPHPPPAPVRDCLTWHLPCACATRARRGTWRPALRSTGRVGAQQHVPVGRIHWVPRAGARTSLGRAIHAAEQCACRGELHARALHQAELRRIRRPDSQLVRRFLDGARMGCRTLQSLRHHGRGRAHAREWRVLLLLVHPPLCHSQSAVGSAPAVATAISARHRASAASADAADAAAGASSTIGATQAAPVRSAAFGTTSISTAAVSALQVAARRDPPRRWLCSLRG